MLTRDTLNNPAELAELRDRIEAAEPGTYVLHREEAMLLIAALLDRLMARQPH